MILPAAYFCTLELHKLGSHLEIEARAKALIVENFIARNPGNWQFQNERLTDVLRAVVLPHTTTTVTDKTGATRAHFAGDVRGLTLERSVPIHEFGEEVGHLRIRDDINHIVVTTLLITLACGLLAAFMYWTLRTVPLAALRDSHARQREEIERRLSAELELRAAQMQLADADRLESVGRLAAGVAHEVKNPLAIIRLGIDYLSHQAPTDDETHHAVLEDIRDAVGRADRIIKDLLNFSRTRTQSRTSLDLNAIVQNALRMTRHDLEIRRINVQCSLQDPLPTMTGDGEQLLQVFINLLVNAAQAIDHDGQISVSTRSIRNAASRADDGAANDQTEWANEVVITDTGPGLPDGVGDEIYEPFFTTKAPGEGTGLGLAVARNIVSWHGGTLTLQNNVDRGATALVTIKLVQESENEADTRS
jgi:signal transduction histidine kinase